MPIVFAGGFNAFGYGPEEHPIQPIVNIALEQVALNSPRYASFWGNHRHDRPGIRREILVSCFLLLIPAPQPAVESDARTLALELPVAWIGHLVQILRAGSKVYRFIKEVALRGIDVVVD